ncbi:alpha/beta fold hydrolase [Paenibacillus sp. GbtcB18]|uniref:alpha/beta fold hydrolase n=1 Tax=Paenibacillus sp. GbtcB18 TaxID=2824763 RepID=UPI001C2FC0F8|nr:alpha/beta hydrolase [Paenibacillus sp. GbtcB18]
MQRFSKMALFMVVLLLLSATTAFAQTSKVDVGSGLDLLIDVQGTSVPGKPTMVFDSGSGDDHTVWQTAYVQQQIAQSTLTVSYDRAGLGQSDDDATIAKNGVTKATQLHALLHNANIPGPYLFVSHSISGVFARTYAALYPSEVAGIIFVDSTHEDVVQEFGEEFIRGDIEYSGEFTWTDWLTTDQQIRQLNAQDALRNTPITVLSANCHGVCDEQNPGSLIDETKWASLQNKIAALSDDVVHTTVDSGHYIQLNKPQAVISAIHAIVTRINLP